MDRILVLMSVLLASSCAPEVEVLPGPPPEPGPFPNDPCYLAYPTLDSCVEAAEQFRECEALLDGTAHEYEFVGCVDGRTCASSDECDTRQECQTFEVPLCPKGLSICYSDGTSERGYCWPPAENAK